MWFTGMKCIRIVVQPSPPSIFRTCSSCQNEALCPSCRCFPFLIPLSSQTLAATTLISLFKNLITPATSQKWKHKIFVFYVWLIPLRVVSSGFIYIVAFIRILFLFKGQIIVHCLYIPHFIYPLAHQWTFRLSLPLGCCE